MSERDPATVEHAAWQVEREAAAREAVARGAALALIELTAVLEQPGTSTRPHVDPLSFVLLAFAARARRLIRSSLRLMDAGEASEAAALLRVVLEIEIVALWLKSHPDRLGDWAIRDHDRRDLVLRKVMAELDEGDVETKSALNAQREELDSRRGEWVTQFGEITAGIPKIEQMAADVGLGFAYQLAYRVQSQSDVHATALSVDNIYDQPNEDGSVDLRAMPRFGLEAFGPYGIAAHLLLDVAAIANDHMKGLLWTTGLAGVRDSLTALESSDPRKNADQPSALLDAAEESTT